MATSSTPSMFSLEGHTALITGGTRGIGKAVAIALAEAGADILLVQVREANTTQILYLNNIIGNARLTSAYYVEG